MTVIPKVYNEMVDFISLEIKPERIINFKASESLQRRVDELSSKEKDNTISDIEKTELEQYLFLEHIMVLAKASAYKRLKK